MKICHFYTTFYFKDPSTSDLDHVPDIEVKTGGTTKTSGATTTGGTTKTTGGTTITGGDTIPPKGGNDANKKSNNVSYNVFLGVLVSFVIVTFVNVLITYNFFNKYSLKDLKKLSLKDIF